VADRALRRVARRTGCQDLRVAVRRVFYDCEFLERGGAIDLVSIGAVDEDGRELYAVSTAFDPMDAIPWVQRHVLPLLPARDDAAWRPRERIRDDLEAWLLDGLGAGDELQLWAWYSAYDHVVLAQLWGAMTALPGRIPRFTHDLRSLWELLGKPELPVQKGAQHDALADARHRRRLWRALEDARRAHDLP
jgi:hypothetical protein